MYSNYYTLSSAEHISGSLNWKIFFYLILLNCGFSSSLVKMIVKNVFYLSSIHISVMGKWPVSALFYTIIEMLLRKLCLILVFLCSSNVSYQKFLNYSLWAIRNWSKSKLEKAINIKNVFKYIIVKKPMNMSVNIYITKLLYHNL